MATENDKFHDEGMSTKEKAAFIRRLVEIRGKRSQKQFARDIGEFQQSVNRYERGLASPHLVFLNRLAKREKVDMNWLFTGKA